MILSKGPVDHWDNAEVQSQKSEPFLSHAHFDRPELLGEELNPLAGYFEHGPSTLV
jgi:hypothetical protein